MLKIGADPEVFVRKGETFISGHIFPCGNKEAPRKVANGAVQVDGMALEFNVNPAETQKEFMQNTYAVFKELNQLVQLQDSECRLVAVPTCHFGEDYIKSVPEENSKLGCNPDWNAYTGEPNPMPDRNLPFRTGSGHIHIGFAEEPIINPGSAAHMEVCQSIVRELDYFLGLPSLLWDEDRDRRKLYGCAGAFRPKSYGLEYRVLSNAWLNNKETIAFVYDRAVRATVRVLNRPKKPLAEKFGTLAQQLINANDTSWPTKYQKIANEVLRD